MLDKQEKSNVDKLLTKQKEARLIRRIVLVVFSVLLLILFGIGGSTYLYIQSAVKPLDESSQTNKAVTIPIGSSVTSIGKILEENAIIKDAKIFKYYVKFRNESGFQAGDYTLSPSMTLEEIIGQLKTGKVVKEAQFRLTIPEGKQLEQIATIISEKTEHEYEQVIRLLTNIDFIKTLQQQYPSLLSDDIYQEDIRYALEGYLYPATYSFYETNPELEEIIESMLSKTEEIMASFSNQMLEKNMTPHQLLTMASLIEEEATATVDREKISSVFYNRLDIGMPLQTDPTVLYAQGYHKDRVLYKDLEIESPYNTYRNQGLPPGPIANAGESSIYAALNPADTDYYYFLATSTGEVIFTKTLEQHNREKAKYITGN